MHIALALFLIGLIFFLKELDNQIWEAAMSVTASAAAVYLLMTLAPCYFPFCPYRTPLSSPELWGYCTQWLKAIAIYMYGFLFETKLRPDFTNRLSWCQRQQHEISNNTTPDEITGDALNWIILHTPESKTRDMAIRSISSLKSEKALKQLVVAPPGILPQVIQSFTSYFPLCTSTGENNGVTVATNANTIALHAQALLVLVNRIMHSPNNSDSTLINISIWGVDNETAVAVEKRFQLLANIKASPSARIVGLTGLSAWRRFVGRTYKSLDGHSKLLLGLTKHLSWKLSPDSCPDILHAVLVESAHWTPKFQGNQGVKLLHRLVVLISDPDPNIPDKFRANLICSLAMLMLSFNQGHTRLRLPLNPGQSDIETCIPYDHAHSIVDYYIQNPGKILGDEPLLLLLALAGLMEYYEHRIFDESSRDNIARIAPLLLTLDIFSRFQSATLPATIWSNVDLREYFIEVLASYFQHAPNDPSTTTIDNSGTKTLTSPTDKFDNPRKHEGAAPPDSPQVHATIPLLQALVSNTTFWKDPACVHALRAPILHVLSRSDDPSVRTVCLKAITSNLERTHSISYVNMLFAFDIPYKLVKLMSTQEITQLRTPTSYRNTAIIFGLLSEDARGPPEGQSLMVEHDRSLGFIRQILSDGLLEAFVRHILSRSLDEYNAYGKLWEGKLIMAIEERLNDHKTRDEKLQGTYNYLKKCEHSMADRKESRMLIRRKSITSFIQKLLALMGGRNAELGPAFTEKDYIRSKIPKLWLDRLEKFENTGAMQSSSPGVGSSIGPGTAQ
ncbi:hypothetical protein FRC11_004672 [Ceratobasidium sp. 423]|nr:hypothetical protein FRC11_004672 [Ceratobasidium sp. 423]